MSRFLLPLGIFLVIATFLAVGLGLNPREIPSPLIDRPAPVFRLPDLHAADRVVDVAELKGRVWLLNVWGTWCPNCHLEHPVLMRLASQLPDASGGIVGLNWKDNSAEARRLLMRTGNPYRQVAVDQAGHAAIDWGVYGAPETFVVDASGTVRYKFIGPLSDAIVAEEIMPLVSRLMAPVQG
ncbi:MAG: DsbE family thiol:disulfide interchange protein [Gammaproteobacteria bacterium]|jgi:cytochrome c biogenesis protein CcmG/thiol:disulfide interchange protein DsbE|nr:DsbE family thiol:disulfide interchange protein [Gammaproteobacteria bacterium]